MVMILYQLMVIWPGPAIFTHPDEANIPFDIFFSITAATGNA